MSAIFSPITISGLTLPNRLVMAPVKTAFASPEGTVTDTLLAYVKRRADGGVGTLISEPMFVHPRGKEHPRQLGIHADHTVEGLSRLVETIHRGGARAVAHINHAGRAANPKATGAPPEAPSALPCPSTGAVPGVLSVTRINELVMAFAEAGRRAREAGFDAVELQCGLGYLVAQFLSPRTNPRTDAYGGSVEGRRRFAGEVIGALRMVLGPLPLVARLSATEKIDGGLTEDDARELAPWLKSQGVAALHVVSGSACDSPPWYYQHMSLPAGANAAMAQRLRQAVSVPIIAAGRLGDPAELAELLADGAVDLVALGRPLVADPELPRKLKEGRAEAIVQCGSCLQGCLTGVKAGRGIGCIVNPELGHEGQAHPAARAPRQVVIVGGGPAGLTAARVAASRGHQVTLLERNTNHLGGQARLAPLAPGKQSMRRPLASLVALAEASGAEIRLGEEATAGVVAELNPDVVVIATGAAPVIPAVPGLNAILTGEAVLAGGAFVGDRVLIIGGGLVGIEVAEHLGAQGKEVVVVEMMEEVARDMEPITRKMTLARLASLPIALLTRSHVTHIDEDGVVTVEGPSGAQTLPPFDTVVAAAGTWSRDDLSTQLRALGMEVHVVGDASELGQIEGAVRSASEVAHRL